jgi:hypothetical protein
MAALREHSTGDQSPLHASLIAVGMSIITVGIVRCDRPAMPAVNC